MAREHFQVDDAPIIETLIYRGFPICNVQDGNLHIFWALWQSNP